MCQALLYDANVCIFHGDFSFFFLPAGSVQKHKTMNYCKQAMFDVFLLCWFQCLCLIFSFFSRPISFGGDLFVLQTLIKLAGYYYRYNTRLIFPFSRRTKVRFSLHLSLNNRTIWVAQQIKLILRGTWGVFKSFNLQKQCIQCAYISSVHPDKKCASLQLLESNSAGDSERW